MESYLAYTSLTAIAISIVSIAITWWALQILRFDILTHDAKSTKAKVLQIILSIILGSQLADFFLNYLNWSMNLKGLF